MFVLSAWVRIAKDASLYMSDITYEILRQRLSEIPKQKPGKRSYSGKTEKEKLRLPDAKERKDIRAAIKEAHDRDKEKFRL